MKREISKENPEVSFGLQTEHKLGRREFLITSARVVIPTLGLMGLSLTMSPSKASAADCSSICTGGCQGACTGCTGSCSGTCHWACSDTCKGTCSGMSDKH